VVRVSLKHDKQKGKKGGGQERNRGPGHIRAASELCNSSRRKGGGGADGKTGDVGCGGSKSGRLSGGKSQKLQEGRRADFSVNNIGKEDFIMKN